MKIFKGLSFLMVVVMLLFCLSPVVIYAEIQFGKAGNFTSYIYEDFNTDNGWKNPSSIYWGPQADGARGTSIIIGGYSYSNAVGSPQGWCLNTYDTFNKTITAQSDKNGTNHDADFRFMWAGNQDIANPNNDYFYAFANGLNSAKQLIPMLSNITTTNNQSTNPNYLSQRLNVSDWTDFAGTVIISYDVLLPATGSLDTSMSVSGQPRNEYLASGTNSSVSCLMCSLPTVNASVKSGVVTATVSNIGTSEGKTHLGNPTTLDSGEGAGISVDISAKAGKWIKVQQTITREEGSTGVYTCSSFIDGQLIKNQYGSAIYHVDPTTYTNSYEYKVNSSGKQNYKGIDISLSGYSTNSCWSGIDNISMRTYGNTTIDKSLAVENGATTVAVPVWNDAVATNAPNGAKYGYIDSLSENQYADDENAFKVTAVLYNADDVLMQNGTSTSVSFSYTNPETKTVTAPTELAGTQHSTLHGDKVYLNIPAIDVGYKLVVSFSGMNDILGNRFNNESIILYNKNTSDVGFVGTTFKDYFDNVLNLSVNGSNYILPSILVKMEFNSLDSSNKNVQLYEGTTKVADAAFATTDGTYTIDVSGCLKPETQYTINRDGNNCFTFTTSAGTVEYDTPIFTSGIANVKYSNSTTVDKDIYFISTIFDDNNNMNGFICEPKTLSASSSGTISTTAALSGNGTQTAYIWDDFRLNDAIKVPDVVGVKAFDNDGKTTVYGTLTPNTKAALGIFKEDGTLVYTKEFIADSTGGYRYPVDFSLKPSGMYRFVVYQNGNVYKNTKSYATADVSETAIKLLNSTVAATGSTASDVLTVITNNQADLEFDYDYYDSLADKSAVAQYLYNYIKGIQAKGGVGLGVTDKQATVSVFRQCVIMEAFKEKKITSIEDVAIDIAVLQTVPVKIWYNNKDGIAITRTNIWRSGITARLSGVALKDIYDFEDKLVESLVYEVIANHESIASLKTFLLQFASYMSVSTDLITDNNVTKLSQDGRTYSIFDKYAKLILDLSNYAESNIYVPKKSTGGGVPTVSISGFTPITVEPITQNAAEDKLAFNDMKGYEWANNAVKALVEKGIVSGNENKFCPNLQITREEFTKLIVELIKPEEKDIDMKFTDVSEKEWYYSYVKKAFQNGIIKGLNETSFGIGLPITRQDMSVLLCSALRFKGVMLENSTLTFTDNETIADYAKTSVQGLVGIKALIGYEDATFRPEGNVTRAEAAKVIFSLLNYFK